MTIDTALYLEQKLTWPTSGRHIMAHYDEASIVVYQAYRPAIGNYALRHQRFGGPFSYQRMSWIKPNFLWMMYRSGWATKTGQEIVLAVRLKRRFFDFVLAEAVPSSFDPQRYSSEDDWKAAVAESSVRLQWDPDHDPTGAKLDRRAIQLGLRGPTLKEYGHEAILEIFDFTEFVVSQRENAIHSKYDSLLLPRERGYIPSDVSVAEKLGIET